MMAAAPYNIYSLIAPSSTWCFTLALQSFKSLLCTGTQMTAAAPEGALVEELDEPPYERASSRQGGPPPGLLGRTHSAHTPGIRCQTASRYATWERKQP